MPQGKHAMPINHFSGRIHLNIFQRGIKFESTIKQKVTEYIGFLQGFRIFRVIFDEILFNTGNLKEYI